MCRRHWIKLPQHNRSEVHRTWRAILDQRGQTGKHETYEKYRTACDAAIEAVR